MWTQSLCFALAAPVLGLAAYALTQGEAPPKTDALPKAETILDKLDATTGDAAARKKAVNIVMNGKIGMAGMAGEGSFEELYAGADRAKYSVTWGALGAMTQGTTGAYSWSTDPAMGITIKEGDEQRSVQRQFAIGRRAEWKTMFDRAETLSKKVVGGRPHWEIKMIPKTGKPETWTVDCETNLLSTVDMALPDPMGGEIAMQFRYADYRRVDGLLYPFLKKQVVGTLEINFTYASVAHVEEMPADRIAPPADVALAYSDPKRRAKPAPQKPGECTLEQIEPQQCATVRAMIKESEVSQTLATILPDVGKHLGKLGVSSSGPPFARYHSIMNGTIDIEAGATVREKIADGDRVKASELPGGKAAVTWHFGPYNELPKTHKLLEDWMKAQKLEPNGGFWEVYWTDPGIEPDPAKWRTQIVWPVK